MTPVNELCGRFLKEPDWALIYPPVVRLYRMAVEGAAQEGCEVYAVCGTRWYAEQTTDFLKGRETPGPNATAKRPLGDTVTGARAGESGHNFGICLDGSRDKALGRRGLQPDEDASHYEPYIRHARRVGLAAVPRPGDAGHVGLNLDAKGVTLRMLRLEFEKRGFFDPKAGLAAVWALLERYGPW